MKYNSIFKSVLLLLSGTMFGQKIEKPNIIFILTDDMAWTDLSCYGHPFNETPNIDKLAQNGIRFTNAYACCPVSSPSRAGFLTGKYPARLQLTNFLVGDKTDPKSPVLPAKWKPYLESQEVTIAEILKQQGYSTGQVGKWHLNSKGENEMAPWGQGFDYSRCIGRNSLDYYNYSIFMDSYNKEFVDSGKNYLTDKLTEYGLEFINQNKQKPFFLYLAYSAPHVYIVPRGDKLKKYFNKYNDTGEKYNPNYAAMIESVDDGVGAIIEKLKNEGLLENTIIVFTSDNGGVGLPELGPTPTILDPLRKWKGHMYEGGIRVPAIISWPGNIPQKTICDQYFSNIDYFPTFFDILNVKELPKNVDGKSILKVLKNPRDTTFDRGAIYWHYPHFSNQLGRPAGGMRLGDYKLVQSYETNKLELYNLKKDISETKDLSKKMKKKTQEMYSIFKSWQKEVNAQMPIPNPNYKK